MTQKLNNAPSCNRSLLFNSTFLFSLHGKSVILLTYLLLALISVGICFVFLIDVFNDNDIENPRNTHHPSFSLAENSFEFNLLVFSFHEHNAAI